MSMPTMTVRTMMERLMRQEKQFRGLQAIEKALSDDPDLARRLSEASGLDTGAKEFIVTARSDAFARAMYMRRLIDACPVPEKLYRMLEEPVPELGEDDLPPVPEVWDFKRGPA